MALQADIQYVRCDIEGTAARKTERRAAERSAAPVYRHRRVRSKVIAVDPVALVGIVLSVVVLCAMAAGLVQYRQSLERRAQMNSYVQQLEQENVQLEEEYRQGYDPEEIRQIALEAGMVPAESIGTVRVRVEPAQQERTRMSFWDTVTTFLTGIFA